MNTSTNSPIHSLSVIELKMTKLESSYVIQQQIEQFQELVQKVEKNKDKIGMRAGFIRHVVSESVNPKLAKKLNRMSKNEYVTLEHSDKQSFIAALNKQINVQRQFISQFSPTSIENVNQLFEDLVGGKSASDAIPSIDLGKTVLAHGAINFITPEMMNNNRLVKFTDVLGRNGLAICVESQKNKQTVQTFYQEMANSPNWVWSGDNIIPLDGKYLISSGSLDVAAYLALKIFINIESISISNHKTQQVKLVYSKS